MRKEIKKILLNNSYEVNQDTITFKKRDLNNAVAVIAKLTKKPNLRYAIYKVKNTECECKYPHAGEHTERGLHIRYCRKCLKLLP